MEISFIMLRFLKWFFGLFSPYVNSFERKVDKFFRHVKSTDRLSSIEKGLLKLMKEDLIIVNVWMERKFKGYKYLSKKVRRKMYEDIKLIEKKLEEHVALDPVSDKEIRVLLEAKGLSFPHKDAEKIRFLFGIMSFLVPGKYYHYIKTASFGKLLRDPSKLKMEGDCNQIVTLYIYLYSKKFNLEDLNIKLLPEHVCLHFKGIDIEATNAKFEKYMDYDHILPVTEIISTNLLDLTDFREDVQKISERALLKSSQLAYAISSLRELVTKNLNIAYRNLGISAINSKNFSSAIFYLSKLKDRQLLNTAYKSAAVYYMEVNNFSKALFYADKSDDAELEKSIKYNEGVHYYKRDKIDQALKVFTALGDDNMKKACYMKKYNALAAKTSGVKTLADAKKYLSTYKKMLSLAQKIGDSILETSVKDILSKL